MPNRYLRESFIESESVNSVSFQAELMWIHLIVIVDDWGRCEANVKLLRPKLFPLRLDQVREADLQRWLAECEKSGLIRRYEHAGKPYLQMIRWEKGRAAESKYPTPQDIVSGCLQPYTSANICLQPYTNENICLHPLTSANGCLQMSPTPTPTPITDSDTDTDIHTGAIRPASCELSLSGIEDKPKRICFTPPTPEEATAYSAEISYPMNGQAWCDSYAQKGWMVGKSKMKDWKAAVRNWKSQGWKPSSTTHSGNTLDPKFDKF